MSFCVASGTGINVSRYHYNQGNERARSPNSAIRRELSAGSASRPTADQAAYVPSNRIAGAINAPNKNIHSFGGGSITVNIPAPSGGSVTTPVYAPTGVEARSSPSQGICASPAPPTVAKHLAALCHRAGSLATPVYPGRATFGSVAISSKLEDRNRRHSLSPSAGTHLMPSSPSASPSPGRRDATRRTTGSPIGRVNATRWQGTSSPPLAPRETRADPACAQSHGMGVQAQSRSWMSVPRTPRTSQLQTSGQTSSKDHFAGSGKFPFGSNVASLVSPRLESKGGLDQQSFAKPFVVQRQQSTGTSHLPFRQGASLTIGPCRSPPRRPVQQVSLDASSLPLDASKLGVGNMIPLDEKAAEDWHRALENARLDKLLRTTVEALTLESGCLEDGCLEPCAINPTLGTVSPPETEVQDDFHDTNASEATDAENHCAKLEALRLEEMRMDEPILYPCKEEYTWADVLPARESNAFVPPTDGFIFNQNSATLVLDDDGWRSTATNPPDYEVQERIADVEDDYMLKLLTPEDVRLRHEGGRTLFHIALGL